MTATTQTVSDFKVLVLEIPNLIDVSGYRQDYIAKKIGLRAENFSTKKRRQSWSIDEVERICNIIWNEDVEDYFLKRRMESLEDEETVDYETFKKEVEWK